VLDDQPDTGAARQTLEVGIGDVDELWVIVPRGGRPLLTRGGAFSYYEFTRAGRLDDDGWRELLHAGKAERPAWARPSGKAPTGRPPPAPRGD
jgi:hypothetical protein